MLPNYKINWHHKKIIKKLDLLQRGEIKKVMIFVPPQHGKSTLSSILFPAYALGKNPDERIALVSYGAGLSSGFAAKTQGMISSAKYAEIFPHTRLARTKEEQTLSQKTRSKFGVVGFDGFLDAVGIQGALTGKSVTLGIIDDPFKDRISSMSANQREKVWGFYLDVFRTRLNNLSRQLLLFTRWHEDDLAGRILNDEKESKGWEVVSFPAILEELSEGDPRQIGDVLWPEFQSKQRIYEQRELDPVSFEALYQQQPTAAKGNLILRDWFPILRPSDIPAGLSRDFYIDTAYTSDAANDPAGFMTVHRSPNHVVLDAYSEHVDSAYLAEKTAEYVARNGYTPFSTIYIEPKASGKTLVSLLRKETRLNVAEYKYPVSSAIQSRDDKYKRASGITPYLRSGHCGLLAGTWNRKFLDEVCGFPNVKHDEMVDLLVFTCLDSIFADSGLKVTISR